MLFYSEQNFFFKVASVFDVFWKPAVLGRTSFIALFDRRAIYEGLNNKKTGSLPPRMFRNEPNLKQVTFLKICIWRFVMECEFTQGGYRYKHGHTWKLASSWVIPLCGGKLNWLVGQIKFWVFNNILCSQTMIRGGPRTYFKDLLLPSSHPYLLWKHRQVIHASSSPRSFLA